MALSTKQLASRVDTFRFPVSFHREVPEFPQYRAEDQGGRAGAPG